MYNIHVNKREFYDTLAGWDLPIIQLFEGFIRDFSLGQGIEQIPDTLSFAKCMSIQSFSNIHDESRNGWQDWECGYYGAISMAWLAAHDIDISHIEQDENQEIVFGHWLEYFQRVEPSDFKTLAALEQKDQLLTQVIWD